MDQGTEVPDEGQSREAPSDKPGTMPPPWGYPYGYMPGAHWPPQTVAPDTSRRARRLGRTVLKVGVAAGIAGGVAVGATLIASAATSSGSNPGEPAVAASSGSTTTTVPSGAPGARPHGFGGGGFGGGGFRFGPSLGGVGGGGSVIYGQYTLKGPNGYETIDTREGTVSSVTDVSGSTWSLVVKSADGTSATFTVDSGTSVNGGEMGISSVQTGNNVDVVAVVNNGTATATEITDTSVLQSNGSSWMPTPPSSTQTPPSGSTTS